MGRPRAAPLAMVTLVACTADSVFHCTEDPQCDAGTCEPTGYCSFEDPDCRSGRRYGALAGDGLARECVELDDDTTSADPATSNATSTTSSTTASDASTDSDPTANPITSSTTAVDTGSSGSTSVGESTETTASIEVTVSFGDRSDADFQDVVEDTTLLGGAINENMGAHDDLHVDASGPQGAWQVGLIRFDVSALPEGAPIVSATLRLWSLAVVDRGGIDVHALTEAWVEGTGDHAPGVCNWVDRLDGTPWTTQGAGIGSFDPTVLATFSMDVAATPYDIDLPPQLVEVWRDDAATNHGLLLRSTELVSSIRIAASEEVDETMRPLLTVTYSE